MLKKKLSVSAAIMSTVLILSSGMALTGCASNTRMPVPASNSQSAQQEQASVEGTAATLDDITITEQAVSDYIQQYRIYTSTTDDSDLATLLDKSGKKVADLRQEAINQLAIQELVKKKAVEQNVEVNDKELDARVDDAKKQLGVQSDSEWEELLKSSGWTKDTYRDDLRQTMLKEKVFESAVHPSEPDDGTIGNYANQYPDNYSGKKAIRVVFDTSTAANNFRLEVGSTSSSSSFRDKGADEVDSGKASKVEDVDWSCFGSPSAAYLDAIGALDVGSVGMYTEDNGTTCVVLVTEEYIKPNSGRLVLADMPSDIKACLISDASAAKRAYDMEQYVSSLLDTSKLKINDMPSGLKYDVSPLLSSYGEEKTAAEKEAEFANETAEQVKKLEEQSGTNLAVQQ